MLGREFQSQRVLGKKNISGNCIWSKVYNRLRNVVSYIQQGIDFEGIPTRTLTILYTMQSLATSIPTCLCTGIPNSTVVPRKGSDKGNVGLSFYSDIYTLCIGGWSPSSCSFYTSSCPSFPLMVKNPDMVVFYLQYNSCGINMRRVNVATNSVIIIVCYFQLDMLTKRVVVFTNKRKRKPPTYT